MKAHLIDTHLLVPRSRSSAKVKVKYQGHVSQKMGVSGAFTNTSFFNISTDDSMSRISYKLDNWKFINKLSG